MPKIALQPTSSLGLKKRQSAILNDIKISEENIWSLVSLGCFKNSYKRLSKKIKSSLNLSLPEPMNSTDFGKIRVSWVGQGQWFLESSEFMSEGFDRYLIEKLGNEFFVTDQSDGWIKFSLSGTNVISALEKCIMLDLDNMLEGSFNRCVLEHIGIYLLCKKPRTSFAIYGPRSSAKSLYHAIVQTVLSV